MTILVTGGSGFIGSHLVERLLKEKHQVKVISRVAKPTNLMHVTGNQNLKIYTGDLLEGYPAEEIFRNIDQVYHLQWSSLPRKAISYMHEDLSNTILTGINLLDHCVANNIKKVIFISSGGAVYGINKKEFIAEKQPTNPISSYGLTKLFFEKYLQLYHHQFGLDYLIFRVANAYGPRQNLNKPQGVISHWCNQILTAQEVKIMGDGSTIRDYIYIKDLIDAFLIAERLQIKNEIINLGGGVGNSLNDILLILKQLGLRFRESRTAASKSDVPRNVLDISKAQRLLNWQPSVSLEDGIKATFLAMKEQYYNSN